MRSASGNGARSSGRVLRLGIEPTEDDEQLAVLVRLALGLLQRRIILRATPEHVDFLLVLPGAFELLNTA